MDPSVVPIGAGVTVKKALKKDLGLLLDANQASYGLKSGSAWHLLFIRAVKTEANGKWVFSLESDTAENVGKIYKKGMAGYDPPRFIGPYPISHSTRWWDPYLPAIRYRGLPIPPPDPEEISVTWYDINATFSPPLLEDRTLKLRWYERHTYTELTEIGTHIYPIAYHRIVKPDDENLAPVAQVVQVARSDWHFWPMPTVPIWALRPQLLDLTMDGTIIGSTISGG